MLRIQLLHNVLGDIILSNENDPVGINEITRAIKRSEKNEGVVFEFTFELKYVKAGRDFLLRAFFNHGGIDADVTVNIYSYDPNARRSSLYGVGTVKWDLFLQDQTTITVSTEQTGFQRRVLNKQEIDVDLETVVSENGAVLPPNPTISIPCFSQPLRKESSGGPALIEAFQQIGAIRVTIPNGGGVYQTDNICIGNIDTTQEVKKGLDDWFAKPWGWAEWIRDTGLGNGYAVGTEADYIAALTADKTVRTENIRFKENGIADFSIRAKLKHRFDVTNTGGDVDIGGSGALGLTEVWAWFEIRDASDNIVFLDSIGSWNMPFVSGNDRESAFEDKVFALTGVVVEVGYKVFVYMTYRIYGDYDKPLVLNGILDHDFTVDTEIETSISVSSLTSTATTDVGVMLAFEAMQRILQFHTNQEDCLVSTLLGRAELGYDDTGDAAYVVFTDGNRLRGNVFNPLLANSAKPLLMNFAALHKFLNSKYCTGFGFEVGEDGVMRVRYEKLEYFYNRDNVVLDLGLVDNPRRKIRMDKYFNQIEFGSNTQLDVSQPGVKSAFNTLRKASVPIVNTNNKLIIVDDFITDGTLIEYERRLALEPDKDGKYDDKTIAILVVPDGGGYIPRTSEGYSAIYGIESPLQTYNLDFAPCRTIRNWGRVLASCLTYAASKVMTVTKAEGSVSLNTLKIGELVAVAEDGDFDVTDYAPIWKPFDLLLDKVGMSNDQISLLAAAPTGVIRFEDLDGVEYFGFVSTEGVKHNPTNKEASIVLLELADL